MWLSFKQTNKQKNHWGWLNHTLSPSGGSTTHPGYLYGALFLFSFFSLLCSKYEQFFFFFLKKKKKKKVQRRAIEPGAASKHCTKSQSGKIMDINVAIWSKSAL
jgi:hypothetical protein